jgi:hypothetical protein
MSAEQASPVSAPTPGRRPRLRPSSSLAAGWSSTPAIHRFAGSVVVTAAVTAAWWTLSFNDYGNPIRRPSNAIGWMLAAWLAWALVERPLLRWLGERRRRRRGGALWWRDRDWRAGATERRLSMGLPGVATPLAVSIGLAGLLCVGGWWYLDTHTNMWGDPFLFDCMYDAPATFVVATYALPLGWLLIVLLPRLGRGRLVVSWPSFPQFTGTRCSFHVGTSADGATIEDVRVFLRCVRVRHRPLLPLDAWNARLVWVAEARSRLGAVIGPESHLRAEFDVPARLPATDLRAADAVRWELLVVGRIGVTDYADSVVVPVYAAA